MSYKEPKDVVWWKGFKFTNRYGSWQVWLAACEGWLSKDQFGRHGQNRELYKAEYQILIAYLKHLEVGDVKCGT